MKDTTEMKQLLVKTVNRMSMYPAEISEQITLRAIIYTVKPDKQDVGKILGTNGSMVAALELIWDKMAVMFGKSATVNIVRTVERANYFPRFKADPAYNPAPEMELLRDICHWLLDDGVDVTAIIDTKEGTGELHIQADDPVPADLLVALDTIFVAIGDKAGCKLKVKIA